MKPPGLMDLKSALTLLLFALGSAVAVDAGLPGSGGRWDAVAPLGVPRQEIGAAH